MGFKMHGTETVSNHEETANMRWWCIECRLCVWERKRERELDKWHTKILQTIHKMKAHNANDCNTNVIRIQVNICAINE